MRLPKFVALSVAMLVALLTVLSIAAFKSPTSAAPASPAARPPWVSPSGKIDRSKLPECFKIVGPDGQVVTGQNGQPLCGKPFEDPIDETPEEKSKRAVPSGERVPYQRPPGVPPAAGDPPQR